MDEQISRRKDEDSEGEAVSRLGRRCLGEAEESARMHRSVSLRKDGRGLSRAVVISDPIWRGRAWEAAKHNMEPLVGKGGGTSVRLCVRENRISQGEVGGHCLAFYARRRPFEVCR